MPARRDIESILIIGAGPIVIGQACEFDYSGTQACRALKAEGYRIVLVNSNPATIMTDLELADATYVEPLTLSSLKDIIAKEKPDALLPTMGGQTALNLAMELSADGILESQNVQIIGASPAAIEKAEDRHEFRRCMASIGLECPQAMQVRNMDEAEAALEVLGLPCIIRPSFTLGGAGSGRAFDEKRFREVVSNGLKISPVHEVQIDRSLLGWKEYELEVVRDHKDNCIVVCSIENIDPMGVHTGDSITVAPAMTLTDREYQKMRTDAIAVLRAIGIETGGSNVQFAVDPETGQQLVVEMNPRVSRSSALASKATGFPIAKAAALLAVGYSLDELKNDCTGGRTPLSFEPALDYVVTKIPRFDFDKFPAANRQLTTRMKSIGEVMAIGSSFSESLQKALRSMEDGGSGFDEVQVPAGVDDELGWLREQLSAATDKRILHVAEAFRRGMELAEIAELTRIDRWFLQQIGALIEREGQLRGRDIAGLDGDELHQLKQLGFSDARLGKLLACDEQQVRQRRHDLSVRPVYKRVDTCAAEFPAATAYLYSTYQQRCEAQPSDRRKVAVLGSGPNRIGQGIEFDYCCVHAAQTLRAAGVETIMINCNPETVSTDYDISDKLYFEPLTLEDVLEVAQCENIEGVIAQFGGQTPLKLADDLINQGVAILGTSPAAIDRAEDREEFRQIVSKLQLRQPQNATARSTAEALERAAGIGYPLIVRPSYVLGGRAMEIVHNDDELAEYAARALYISGGEPVLLDRFLQDALEIDVDAVCDGKDVMVAGILEHVEQAGVHSGDSACSLPARSLSDSQLAEVRRQTRLLALELGVVGLMNVQYALTDGTVFLIEANPRASRTAPFVSKCIGLSLPAVATRCLLGESLKQQGVPLDPVCPAVAVKEAVFPFARFPDEDPTLGPEMRSTGEVMGLGEHYPEAFRKSQEAVSGEIRKGGKAFVSVRSADKRHIRELARDLHRLGFALYATSGTAQAIRATGLEVETVNKVREGEPHAVGLIDSGEINIVVNTTEGRASLIDSASIRQAALRKGIYITTTMAGASSLCQMLKWNGKLKVRSLQDLHQGK